MSDKKDKPLNEDDNELYEATTRNVEILGEDDSELYEGATQHVEVLDDEDVNAQEADETAELEAASAAEAEEDESDGEESGGQEALESRLLRLQADFDNFRKRIVREKAEWNRVAQEAVLLDLLPVLDHYELGLKTAQELDAKSAVVEGFQLVYDQLQQLLKKFGVEVIDAVGQTFDPNLHEALTSVPSEDHPANTVVDQNRKGYQVGERLLRPAQVMVSSGPAGEEGSAR